VVLYQSAALSDFLSELFKGRQPPHKSLIDDVHEDKLFEIWRKNPGVQAHEQAAQSKNPALRAFGETLDPTFEIIDLRAAAIGFGFPWGRYGANTVGVVTAICRSSRCRSAPASGIDCSGGSRV
jgi:hypothetical protein